MLGLALALGADEGDVWLKKVMSPGAFVGIFVVTIGDKEGIFCVVGDGVGENVP